MHRLATMAIEWNNSQVSLLQGFIVEWNNIFKFSAIFFMLRTHNVSVFIAPKDARVRFVIGIDTWEMKFAS